VTLDGKRQRNALTAAENAIRALGAGDGVRARSAAVKAVELDQIGAYADFAAAVDRAAVELAGGGVSSEAWQAMIDAVGPGPLVALIDEARITRRLASDQPGGD
jgi:hypothetical protein